MEIQGRYTGDTGEIQGRFRQRAHGDGVDELDVRVLTLVEGVVAHLERIRARIRARARARARVRARVRRGSAPG